MLTIKDWDSTFENSESRKRQRLGWLYCPTGLDSAGYVELMALGEQGVLAFGVFIAICQWSATRLPLVRGVLSRNDGSELSIAALSRHVRMDESIVTTCLDILQRPEIGWICGEITESATNLPPICRASATNLPAACHKDKDKGKEKVKDKGRTFQKPSVHEVVQYCTEKGFTFDPEAMWDHYESNGWVVGRHKMKDWKAAARNWSRRNFGDSKITGGIRPGEKQIFETVVEGNSTLTDDEIIQRHREGKENDYIPPGKRLYPDAKCWDQFKEIDRNGDGNV